MVTVQQQYQPAPLEVVPVDAPAVTKDILHSLTVPLRLLASRFGLGERIALAVVSDTIETTRFDS